jgi:bifunctional non-homologous end joining protein LigD
MTSFSSKWILSHSTWYKNPRSRQLPLITRKQHLRKLIPNRLSSLLYVDHIEERGQDLFQLACREDLEGIVAKRKDGPYDPGASWVKIKNPAYTQIIGRNELF